MAFKLQPLPRPGLTIYPGFTAMKPETFIMKEQSTWSSKNSFLISFATPSGEPGAPFVEISEEKRKTLIFKTMNGQEVMRIEKQTHSWSGKMPEYHGMRSDGNEVWSLKLHRGWSGTDYNLTVDGLQAMVQVQNKVLGEDKGILLNGVPAVTMSNSGGWSHLHRRDLVHVAPGMDILLALGVAWIRADKQAMDAKAASSGGDASASVAAAAASG